MDELENFYSSLPERLAAVYRFDVPAGTTIQGTPELHALLDSEREDFDGLMITAVLMDVSDSGAFMAYMPKASLRDNVESEELTEQTIVLTSNQKTCRWWR